MIAAALLALALAQPNPMDTSETMKGVVTGHNPNLDPSSVHVDSVTNPMYSFPADVDTHESTNGRLFRGTAIIGGVDVGPKTDLARAAARFGAFGDENVRVQADVEGLFRFHPTTRVEFSPWAPVAQQLNSPASDPYSRGQEKLARRAEEARQQWLADNGYTGGVRTFVNDAELYPLPPEAKKSALPEPRGVIQLAPDVPAFKSRMHVQGAPAPVIHMPAGTRTAELIKVVRPEASKVATTQPDAKVEAKADDKPQAQVAAK
jgi:hypothetical protein